ncbi:MAG: cellulase family glycosylhydrolase, partial [Thermoanaerobaculia bacterium]|nr:cellulase family glycosylhydrolase [Thermoanaerobaculia bacterium]
GSSPSRASLARSESPWGINVHAPEEERLRLLFDSTAAAGIDWVRIDFVWAVVEPKPGLVDWTVYDEIVTAARARGLRVLALIGYTPAWATDGSRISGVPRRVHRWSDFCYRAARRYRDDILHWEVWNEPNLPRFWTGSRLQYIEGILEPAARAIRSANPEARIGGPGLGHFVSGEREWHAWLLDILREAGHELDFLTHHAYDLEDPRGVMRKLLGVTPSGDEPAAWKEEPPSLREVLAHASWDRPVWLTETGWVTSRLDESRQADHYRTFLDLWASPELKPPWLEKVFFYELQDDRNPNVPNYGILRVSGREKPAYRVLRRFIADQEIPPNDDGNDRTEDGEAPRPGAERPRVPIP